MSTPIVAKPDSGLLRDGAGMAVAGLLVAVTTAAVIAVPNWNVNETAGRMAIAGVIVFGLALALGSARIIGGSSFLVLGSAFIVSATSDETLWVESIVVGCLWYVAVELAWESIDRRDWAKRSAALDLRRVNEVATVVVVSLLVTVSAYAAASVGAARTLSRQAVVVVALFAAVGFAIRRIVATAPAGQE